MVDDFKDYDKIKIFTLQRWWVDQMQWVGDFVADQYLPVKKMIMNGIFKSSTGHYPSQNVKDITETPVILSWRLEWTTRYNFVILLSTYLFIYLSYLSHHLLILYLLIHFCDTRWIYMWLKTRPDRLNIYSNKWFSSYDYAYKHSQNLE